jgi:hypothetical protein
MKSVLNNHSKNKKNIMEIKDFDIATIEHLHDLLLEKGVSLENSVLVRSRELTQKMYNEISNKCIDPTGVKCDSKGDSHDQMGLCHSEYCEVCGNKRECGD